MCVCFCVYAFTLFYVFFCVCALDAKTRHSRLCCILLLTLTLHHNIMTFICLLCFLFHLVCLFGLFFLCVSFTVCFVLIIILCVCVPDVSDCREKEALLGLASGDKFVPKV